MPQVSVVRPRRYRCRAGVARESQPRRPAAWPPPFTRNGMSRTRGPLPNSYQLLDGRLIAGEYPGDRNDAPARQKLGALLAAGVTCFVDLTEPHELRPYDGILAEEAAARGVRARHVRLSIGDVSVPRAPELMRAILDAIDAELKGGGKVYVHCWGGVGRT